MIFYSVVLLLLIFIIFSISKLFSGPKETKDIKFNWFLDKAYRDSIGVIRTQKPSYPTLDRKLTEIYDEYEFLKREIMPGRNYIKQADSYSYDTELIRKYIRGEQEYDGEKLVFLTFDDGPNTVITPQILEILKKNDVHATFFVVGNRIVEDNYKVLHETVFNGNAIALHTFDHDYEKLYPEKVADGNELKEQLMLSESRLRKVFSDDFKVRPWRYPGGHMSWDTRSSDEITQAAGYEWIDWNSFIGDAEPKATRPTNAKESVNILHKSLNQNLHNEVAVVLMHDAANKQITANSLQSVIDYFKENNYKFGILK